MVIGLTDEKLGYLSNFDVKLIDFQYNRKFFFVNFELLQAAEFMYSALQAAEINYYLCSLNLFSMTFNTFIGMIGPNQILLIALVLVLLFGARKIPELMKGIGQGIKEFKNAKEGTDEQKDKDKLEQKNS